jgi:hypothetical protein
MPNGATPTTKTSIAYIYQTWPSAAKTTSETHPGPLSQRSPPRFANEAHMRPSWSPTSPTKLGTMTYTGSHPKRYTSPPQGTCSSPAGSANTRGSDHPVGASWSFGPHPGVALHTSRRHRQVPTRRACYLQHGPTRVAGQMLGHTTLPPQCRHHPSPEVCLYGYHLPSPLGHRPFRYNRHWPTQRLPRAVNVC